MGGKTLVIGTALAVLLVYSVGPAQSAGFNGVEHQSAGDQAWDSVYPEIREALRKVSNSEFILDHFFHAGKGLSSRQEKRRVLRLGKNYDWGVRVSFGDVVALAGDFFGVPSKPISQSPAEPERLLRFWEAYGMFSRSSTGSKETPLILQLIKQEEIQIEKFKRMGKVPSKAWGSKRLGLRHEMAFAHITRSDTGMKNKMKRVSEEKAGAPEPKETPETIQEKAKSMWEKVKSKMSDLHAYTVEKSKAGYSAIKGHLQRLDDLFDKDARYLALAKVNFDHFLPHSRLAYKAGHQLAIAAALQARKQLLAASKRKSEIKKMSHVLRPKLTELDTTTDMQLKGMVAAARVSFMDALALDGMACHFLTDMFAPGHLRTPRVALHNHCDKTTGALLSKCSHDQDNKNGMFVVNELGDKWFALGDSMYFDEKNRKNRAMAVRAVKASIREVLYAFTTGKTGPTPSVMAKGPTKSTGGDALGRMSLKANLDTMFSKISTSIQGFHHRFVWDDYLKGDDTYNANSIVYEGLKIAPSPKLSEPLNKLPAMFKMIGKKLSARRKIEVSNPHVDNLERFVRYKYVPLGKICQTELLRQNCDVI